MPESGKLRLKIARRSESESVGKARGGAALDPTARSGTIDATIWASPSTAAPPGTRGGAAEELILRPDDVIGLQPIWRRHTPRI